MFTMLPMMSTKWLHFGYSHKLLQGKNTEFLNLYYLHYFRCGLSLSSDKGLIDSLIIYNIHTSTYALI